MADALRTGDVVADKYRILEVIGRGGVGVVLAAEHATLGRRVALKVLRAELADDPEVVERFLREGRAAAQLQSEHVARVIDADTMEGGAPYLVMELLEGRDFGALLKEGGPLPSDTAVDYVMQACEAVAEAHALGIVHRDLKSANLFLTKSADGMPLVKVLDFGLSKVDSTQSHVTLTSENRAIGSPHFMSPEQMRSSRDVDARTDIWALGVVLYAFLAGRVPFDGASLTEVCAAVLLSTAPRLASLRADLPSGLDEVVGRCMRVEPDDRFQSVRELASALAPFAAATGAARVAKIDRLVARRGPAATGAPPSSGAVKRSPPRALAATDLATMAAPSGLQRRGRTLRELLLAAGAGLVAVAGAAALFHRPPGAALPSSSVPTSTMGAVVPAVPAPSSAETAGPVAPPLVAHVPHRPATGPRGAPLPASAPGHRPPKSEEDVILNLPH